MWFLKKKKDKQNECGLPVLVKISSMNKPTSIRDEMEAAILKVTPFTRSERREYLDISQKYNLMWAESDQQGKDHILTCLKEWRRYIEYGYSPKEAQDKVTEWLNSSNE